MLTIPGRDLEKASKADLFEALVDSTPKNWVFVVGNGINQMVLKNGDSVKWSQILLKWLNKAEEKLSNIPVCLKVDPIRNTELSLSKSSIIKMLIESGDADLMIEAADMILSLFNDSEKKALLKESFAGLFAMRKEPKTDGNCCWQHYFSELGKAIREERIHCPAVATTNFDDVLAQLLGCHIRCWNLAGLNGEIAPRDRDNGMWKKIDREVSSCADENIFDSRLSVPSHLRRLGSLAHLEELRRLDLLGSGDLTVYHLHGWWALPETLVFDASGYDNSLTQFPAVSKLLQKWLSSEQHVVVFIGVGPGMFDRRFTQLWNHKVSNWNNNFWLVSSSDSYQALARHVFATPFKLRFVECPRDEQASLMLNALKRAISAG